MTLRQAALGWATALQIPLLAFAPFSAGSAQELEPRAYSWSPVGANFIGAGFSASTGAVVFDPSIPITDANADVYSVTPGYARTFALGRMQALAGAVLPYAWGSMEGKVEGVDRRVTRSGIGDLRAKLSVNLIGGPALKPQAFAKARAAPIILGTSFTITAPTGQYYPDRLINIGTHRWAFKPEVGISYNWRTKLYLDFYVGASFFTDNTSFYPGTSTRHQDPILSLQSHVSYVFRRRLWVALDGTWYTGGAAQVNDDAPIDREDNTRLGATLSWGFTARQSVKLSFSSGASVRAGANFQTVGLAYQYLFF